MDLSLKRKLYLTAGLLVFSGIAYAIPVYLDRWFFYQIHWGLSRHLLMASHGLAAFVALFLLGYLYRCHAMVYLRGTRHRHSGVFLLAVWFCLAFSGYGLYYLGNVEWRLVVSDIHCLVGVSFPFLLIVHRLNRARS